MKRTLAILIGSCILAFAVPWPSYAIHLVTQLTDNTVEDGDPAINTDIGYALNDSGVLVWQGWDGSDWEIYLTEALSVNPPPMTNNSVNDMKPDINNSGVVVWQRYVGTNDNEIFMDDGMTVSNISNNPSSDDTDPRVSDTGYVAWQGYYNHTGTQWNYEIYVYDGSTVTNASNDNFNDDVGPRVNNSGHVVWQKQVLGKAEIYFWNGGTPQNLSNTGGLDERDPEINDSDGVVWAGWDGNDWEIFFWNGTVHQITYNDYDDYSPRINNNGYVVWHGSDGTDNEIFFWNGHLPVQQGDIIQVTNNAYGDSDPWINQAGHVAWRAQSNAPFWQIFLWDGPGGTITQVTSTDTWKDPPKINDNPIRPPLEKDILWKGKVSYVDDMEIYAAISCTDQDQDGYCSVESGGEDCDDTPGDDQDPPCSTCTCGDSACSVCARCIHPGAPEVCDGADNNCVNGIDEDPEASQDCDNGAFCDGAEYCSNGGCQPGTPPCQDDGLYCNGTEGCDEVNDQCTHSGSPCQDGNPCTDDSCNEDLDTCEYPCNAANNQDPCCQDPVCAQELVCQEPCTDNDGDGFGNPASPGCTYPYLDCDDDPSDDPPQCASCTCGSQECAACARCINPYPTTKDFSGDGIDSDCDGSDCFIATAAFGTELQGKIDVLRAFRDQVLLDHPAGRAFVSAYYRYSPPVARYIADHGWLRASVRAVLLPLVGFVWLLL